MSRAHRRLHRRLGFGGSIAAWRLAELYRAAGADPTRDRRPRARPALRPRRLPPVDGRRAPLRRLHADPGPGGAGRRRQPRRRRLQPLPRRLAALAERDLRAPRPPPRRRARAADVAGGDQPRARSNRYYARAERALRVSRPSWNQVSKSGGLWAATLRCRRAHLRPRAAGDRPRALRRREVVPHRLHLRRQEHRHHQLPRRGRARPGSRSGRCTRSTPSVPRARGRTAGSSTAAKIDPATRAVGGASTQIECKVLILAAGAMGNAADPAALAHNGSLPSLSGQRRPHLGVNGDHVAADRVRPAQGPRRARAARLRRSSTRASRSRR